MVSRKKKKEREELLFCYSVFELIFGHPCYYVVCAYFDFFGEVGHFTERSFWSCMSSAKSG